LESRRHRRQKSLRRLRFFWRISRRFRRKRRRQLWFLSVRHLAQQNSRRRAQDSQRRNPHSPSPARQIHKSLLSALKESTQKVLTLVPLSAPISPLGCPSQPLG